MSDYVSIQLPMLYVPLVQISITSPDTPLPDYYYKFDTSANDAEFTAVGVTKYTDPFFPPVSMPCSNVDFTCPESGLVYCTCIMHMPNLPDHQ